MVAGGGDGGFRMAARRRSSGFLNSLRGGEEQGAGAGAGADEEARAAETGVQGTGGHHGTSMGRSLVGAIKRRSLAAKSWHVRSSSHNNNNNSRQNERSQRSSLQRRGKRKNLSVRFDVDIIAEDGTRRSRSGSSESSGDGTESSLSVGGLLVGSPSRDKADPDTDGVRSEVGDYLREMFSNDGSSVFSADDAEAAFLFEPSPDPEVLLEQFRVASAHSDAFFVNRILDFEHEQVTKTRFGMLEYLIPPAEKAKALALAMLSGKVEVYRALEPSTSVLEADAWLDNVHPHSRCACDSHRGLLLVRLVRSGDGNMTRAALKAGLDPNTRICDGNTRRMLWHDFPVPPRNLATRNFVREPSKLEATFEKSTPLSSAASTNDIRMLKLLLEFGADPTLENYSAFGVAARFGHTGFLEHLLNLYSVRIADPSDEHFVVMQQASTVALKDASAAGQEATVDWILRRLQHTFEWGSPRVSSLQRRSTFRAVSLRRATEPSQTSFKGPLKSRRRHTTTAALPAPKQQVAEVLDMALEELIEEGIEPGASLRFSIAQGIALITNLQKSRFAEFAPQQLLRFYVLATSDTQMPTGEDIVSVLLDCGLAQYLAGVETKVRKTASGRYSATPVPSEHPETDEAHAAAATDDDDDDDARERRASQQQQQQQPVREQRVVERTHADHATSVQARVQTSLRVVANVTGRLWQTAVAYSKEITGATGSMKLPFTPNATPSPEPPGPVATDKERHSAVFTAVQRGHRVVLQLLLGLCNDERVEHLLTEAVRYDQEDMARMLLEEIRTRAERKAASEEDDNSSDPDATEVKDDSSASDSEDWERHELSSSGVPNVVLRSAWRAALCVGHVRMADLLLDYGVEPRRRDVRDVLSIIALSSDRAERVSVGYILDSPLTSALLFDSDLSTILYEGVNDDQPNFHPLKDMLAHAPFAFAEVRHLRRILHRSCGQTQNENWRLLTELCVKNMHLSDVYSEDLDRELPKLLTEAEALPDVHVSVLTFLMQICKDHHHEDGDDDRWI